MEPWFWFLASGFALLGIALFGISQYAFERRGQKHTRWETVVGLAGLALLAWGVLLAVIGGVISVVGLLS